MIISLHLTNFTIISKLDLDFQQGMSVFTGETGAGKSIIIDAIQLALGARLDTKVVREGCDKSEITLVFDIQKNTAAKSWLEQHELTAEQECILRRSINQDGRSRAFINDQPATLNALQELGSLLLNIHGQHHQYSIIKKEEQLALLDRYGQHENLLKEIKAITQDWQNTQKQYQQLQNDSKTAAQKQEFLQFQLDELEVLALKDNEIEELDLEYKQLSNAESLLQNTQLSLELIAESDTDILSQLNHCLSALENDKDLSAELKNAYELLTNASVLIEEAHSSIKLYHKNIDINPERLNEIDARLTSIHDVARKHRVNPKELKAFEEKLQSELNALENSEETLQQLQAQLNILQKAYDEKAKLLTQKRQATATALSKLITKDIQALNMRGGKFEIALQKFSENTPNALGQERAEFLVAANTGQSLAPLAKVASGGELSRIGLAIQVNTAKRMQTPALIFDEVDTGIGGATADMVGELLKRLGEATQVFCITHLAQVASKAHNHFKVEKFVKNKQTFTAVIALAKEDKPAEIARMLGGSKITKESLDHAKVMLAQ